MAITSLMVEYDPQWPLMFEIEKSNIEKMLGALILDIQHIGSTAIPGIKAKPEIDLLLIINRIGDIEAINSGMNELGYDVRGECGIKGRYYYSKNVNGARTHKAHACENSHENVARQIAFRDYMRDHPQEAYRYGELKQQLAEENKTGIAEYLDGKKNYIEKITCLAFREGYGSEPNKTNTTNALQHC